MVIFFFGSFQYLLKSGKRLFEKGGRNREKNDRFGYIKIDRGRGE